MTNMSVDTAMGKLKANGNATVLSLVKEVLANKVRAGRRTSSARNLRASQEQDQDDDQSPTEKGYSGVDKAKNMINEMIEETQAKYDKEIQACCDYDQVQSGLIEQARQDISNFNAEAAEARKEVLDAQDHIEICEKKLPELKDALTIHNRECDVEAKNLRGQLVIIDEDLRVMNIILGMLNCDKDKDGGSSLLVFSRCEDECTGEAFVSFGHEQLQNLTSTLQSNVTRQLLTDSLMAAEGDEEDQVPTLDATMNTTVTTTWAAPELPSRTLTRSGPCKTPVPEDKRTGKCSLDANPNCERMQEKFMYIQSGIQDKRDEVQTQLDQLLARCKIERENLEAQISDMETQLQDQLVALAAATKKQNTAEEQSRLKSTELKAFVKDYDEMTVKCHTNYEVLEGDECGLKKIRGELYKMQGQDHPAFFQDCIVSEWLAGECSKTCAGGTMKLTREIVTAPVGGAACPVMEEMKDCNPDKCPIDCKLEDWGGWSSCTAKCGGGLMERERDLVMEAQHGGEPCEETKEAKSCNLQSCDKDCELSDWTEWGDCSKACNGGEQERAKTISVPLQGDGSCPVIRDALRLQTRSCNAKPCKNELMGFKCFRFTPTKLRNNRRANSVQISDIFLKGDAPISMKNFKAKNPGGRSPRNEEPHRAVDENPQTKWLDFKKGALVIESKSPVKASGFRFTTANDATERDPMAWKMEGSADCSKYEMLHQTSWYNTPGSRFSPTAWFPFPTKPLRCGSEEDIVLLLDGSGSLKSDGWKAIVDSAKMLANSFLEGGKVNLAIVIFASKTEWVQHFSMDLKKTLENLDKVKWPKGGTKTSEALNMANSELSLGRADAKSTVIVITDGAPLSPKKTEEAAKVTRKDARLMFLAVTKMAPLASLKEMVSYPKQDNLLPLQHFADLTDEKTNDFVVSAICPKIF
eukprot:TRINITY_DN988_c0_g1_i4.p1 TRINITY_DN988_c0_g1~~TRINITY_DN988_c0_g1_i4.p1  ORF type:complete len:1003 (-),score=315.27 TRINITY_DN988_c0_g1_i4:170-2938(-)